MTPLLRKPAVQWLAGAVVGAVLVYASYEKILDPPGFARVVYRYHLVGPGSTIGFVPANLVAVVLPWLELVTGLLLLLNAWRREAAVIAGGLMAAFIAGVASTMARGIDLEGCGCFTLEAGGRAAGWGLVAGDAALLLLAVVAMLAPHAAAAPEVAAQSGAPATAP